MAIETIAITEPEAKAIIGRLRRQGQTPPLHSIELSLLGRLAHELRELDHRAERHSDIAQMTFDFGDV